MITNFFTTEGGEELAILPRAAYEALIDAADEARDLADGRARRGGPTLPLRVGMAGREVAAHRRLPWACQE